MEIWGLEGVIGTYNKIKKGEFQKLLCSLAGQSITTSPLLCFFFFFGRHMQEECSGMQKSQAERFVHLLVFYKLPQFLFGPCQLWHHIR